MITYNFGKLENLELNSGWALLPDPMGRCRRQQWWRKTRLENHWFPSYDDDAFWPTTVPGAFTRLHPELEYFEGTVVYLNCFESEPSAEGERVFLHFDGVAERADVFLNGCYLGRIQTGFTPFTFDVSRELAAQNRLMVLIENTRHPGDVPGEMHDWWHDGGIIRPVRLYRRPATVFVREAAVATRLLDGGQVELTFRVLLDAPTRNDVQLTRISLRCSQSGKGIIECTLEARPGSWCETRVTLSRAELPLWSCDNPQLCELRIAAGTDVWHDTVGLREVRTRGREMLINGYPVILRGVCTWVEDPQHGLFSMDAKTADKTVEMLRGLNCNFARAGHRPQSREFIRACDAAGILVWQETPAYWIPTMAEPAESRHALENLAGMVCDFRNSPSVILWSIGNECLSHNFETGPSNLAYFLEAAEFLHREDPSRLVTYTGGLEGNRNQDFLNEVFPQQIADKVDVVSFNCYAGINEGVTSDETANFSNLNDVVRFASSYGKPVIHAEAGIDSVLGEKGFDFGEERSAAYHRKLQKYFAEQTAAGHLQGLSIFVLCDYRTPIKLNRHQRGYNRKGLLTENFEPKLAFAIVRDGYAYLALMRGCSSAQPLK